MYGNPPVGQIIGDVNNWKTTFGRESGENTRGAFFAKTTFQNVYQSWNFFYVCKRSFLAMQRSFRLVSVMLGVIRAQKTSLFADFDHCLHADDMIHFWQT